MIQKRILVGMVALLLAIFAGYLAHVVEPVVFEGESLSEEGQSLPLTLIGQLRISLDDYLWLRTDDYLHFGISERRARKTLTKTMTADFSARMGEPVENGEQPDWRGIFAELELFHPIKGNHGDPLELLPWYRVQTAINPTDISAYVNGAFFLADCAKKPAEAVAFLEEGLQKNPDDVELLESLGRLYYEKWKDAGRAIAYLQKAVGAGKEMQRRSPTQEEAFGNAYLFLARALREQGNLDAALQAAEEGISQCPNNALLQVIRRVIKRDIAAKR